MHNNIIAQLVLVTENLNLTKKNKRNMINEKKNPLTLNISVIFTIANQKSGFILKRGKHSKLIG